MSHPLVVHHKRSKCDVLAFRPHKWGNQFKIGPDGDRAAVIAKHREHTLLRPFLVDEARQELAGKVLGCWCAPKDCHCDLLAALAASKPVCHEKVKSTCRGDCGGGCHDCTLYVCKHCGGIEGTLTSECPRVQVGDELANQVYEGRMNYIFGEWVHGSIDRQNTRHMPFWCGIVHIAERS